MSYDAYRPRTTSVKLSLPLNGTIYTTTREVPAEKTLPLIGATMSAELGPAFATSRIIEATEVPSADGTKKVQTLVHAIIPSEADQLDSNWEYATCSIGGQRFHGITRTVIYLASAFSKTTPAEASAMPISAGTSGSDYGFTGDGYILTSRRASRSGMQLEPVFRVEVREFVKRATITNVGVDGLNGKPLFDITTLYHASETPSGAGVTASALFTVAQSGNSFWGIQANGFENAGSQLSAEWFALTSSQVVAGEFNAETGVVAISTAVPSNDEYTWPPVLQFVEFMDWTKREGGEDIYPMTVWKHELYRGPCKTETTRTWSKTDFVIPVVEQMLPNDIDYASPFFSLQIPACLHGDVPCQCDIGNADPEYTQNTGSLRVFLATNEVDWPASIVAYDDQEPYRGGYLRTRKVVYSPAGTGGGAPVVTVALPTGLAASLVTDTTATLAWTATAGATGHLLEVATDALFVTRVIYRKPVALATDALVGLTPGTAYWARVSTFEGSFMSAPCAAITFTTDP